MAWILSLYSKKAMKKKSEETGKHEHPLPHEISAGEKQQASFAHDEAEKDMEEDAEFTASSPNDDLDEAESARLGEENPLI